MSTRVLVVEDDAMLALDTAGQSKDGGFVVIGPATSVAWALKLISETGCDVGVLDVNLGKESAEPVARELRARGTPFVVLSGCGKGERLNARPRPRLFRLRASHGRCGKSKARRFHDPWAERSR